MLSVPYLTPTGVVKLKMRCLQDHDCKHHGHPKYDGPSGPARLYGVTSLARGGDVVVITEGEFDAMVGEHLLGVPCVGTPGTTWLEHWPRCFADFERTLVVADHDAKEDGSDPGLKHAKAVVKAIPGAELVLPPSGQDLSEWILSAGADNVRKAMGL